MRCKALGILLIVGCVLLTGCSQSTTHGVIEGKVTLDGQPLKEGTVRFVPMDGESQTSSAAIAEGEFVATVPVGQVRIQYSAPKLMGKQKMYDTEDSPTVDVVGELLPNRYNIRSDLELTVEPGKNSHEINLDSK